MDNTFNKYQVFFVEVNNCQVATIAPWKKIWKSWAPPRCKFFMWLAENGRCRTADRLARRNLPHPQACPLCDQAEETIDHLLVSCFRKRGLGLGFHEAEPSPSSKIPGCQRMEKRSKPANYPSGLGNLEASE